MSYYSVANSHCDKYRDAIDKINKANSYLQEARSLLAKNKSGSTDELILSIDKLYQYELEKTKEIKQIINQTLIEARSRDIAAKKRAEAQDEYNRNLKLKSENK